MDLKQPSSIYRKHKWKFDCAKTKVSEQFYSFGLRFTSKVTWRDPSEWTGLNCSSASFGWFFLLGFLVVLSIKSGQQTGVQTYP